MPPHLSLYVVERYVLANVSIGNLMSSIFRGLDLLDGTPILDIKPYIPAYDAPSSSSSSTSNVRVPSWINNPGDDLQVELTPRAERGLAEREFEGQSDRQLLRRAIVDILSADPRYVIKLSGFILHTDQ